MVCHQQNLTPIQDFLPLTGKNERIKVSALNENGATTKAGQKDIGNNAQISFAEEVLSSSR